VHRLLPGRPTVTEFTGCNNKSHELSEISLSRLNPTGGRSLRPLVGKTRDVVVFSLRRTSQFVESSLIAANERTNERRMSTYQCLIIESFCNRSTRRCQPLAVHPAVKLPPALAVPVSVSPFSPLSLFPLRPFEPASSTSSGRFKFRDEPAMPSSAGRAVCPESLEPLQLAVNLACRLGRCARRAPRVMGKRHTNRGVNNRHLSFSFWNRSAASTLSTTSTLVTRRVILERRSRVLADRPLRQGDRRRTVARSAHVWNRTFDSRVLGRTSKRGVNEQRQVDNCRMFFYLCTRRPRRRQLASMGDGGDVREALSNVECIQRGA